MAENEDTNTTNVQKKNVNIRLHLCSQLCVCLGLIRKERAARQLMTLFWVRCEVEGDNEVAVSDMLEMDRTNT